MKDERLFEDVQTPKKDDKTFKVRKFLEGRINEETFYLSDWGILPQSNGLWNNLNYVVPADEEK